MDLEQDYVIYAIEASLTFLAVSSSYFIDISRPITLLALLPSTALLGYTAHVSRERFRPQSAISLLALVFLPLGGVVAVTAVAITLINFLTSIFASGESFKDYYGSTSIPLLLGGLVLGSLLFGLTVSNPAIANTVQEDAASFAGLQAEGVVNRSNMLESKKGKQIRLVNATSQTTFRLTRTTVLGQMGRNSTLNSEQYRDLEEAFNQANRTLDEGLKQQAAENIKNSSIDVSSRVSDLVRNTLQGKALLLLIPLVTFGVYSLHPVVGILTAIWASFFAAVNVRISGQTDSKELDSPSEI